MKSQLQSWGIEIDTLRKRADEVSAGARAEIQRQIKQLMTQQSEATTKMQEMVQSHGLAWADIARGIDRAFHDVRSALEGAAARTSKSGQSGHQSRSK